MSTLLERNKKEKNEMADEEGREANERREIAEDESFQAFEIVQETAVGGDFRDREVFR